MSKWEITAGREDLVWYDRESRPDHKNHWWVMTWIKNGSKFENSFSPIPVWCMEDGQILMTYYAPYHAVKFGDSRVIATNNRDMFYILQKNIWARMPMIVPDRPNVVMFFNTIPFTNDE